MKRLVSSAELREEISFFLSALLQMYVDVECYRRFLRDSVRERNKIPLT